MPALPLGVVAGHEVATFRISTAIGGVAPYLFGASAGGEFRNWYRVAGAETMLNVPSSPFLNMPGVNLVIGAAYPLDEPFRHNLRVYSSLVYRP
jgi:hypothetical protein